MKIQEVMNKYPVIVGKDAPISDVADLLVKYNLTAVSVVDDNNKLLGIISEGDLLYKKVRPHVPHYVNVLGASIYYNGIGEYNAKFKKGATVHLQGEEAQEFVQGRDIMVSGSAYSRIGRQKRYLKAFISQAKKTLTQNPALAVNLMSQLSDYMLTDISTDEVLYLSTELSGCNFDEENMQILQGNIQMGEQYEEYYLDDEAVQQTIIDLFYEEQKK